MPKSPFPALPGQRSRRCRARSRPLRWPRRLRRPPRTRAGLHAHRERRPLQRIHLPRHLPDRRQARGARRLRLGAFERLLSRHVGIEHQLARGFRPRTRAPASSGISTAATRARSTKTGTTTSARSITTTRAAAIPASSTPTPGKSTPRSTGNGSARRRRTASTTTSARNPSARRPTARGISTSTPTIRSAKRASRCSGTSGSSTSVTTEAGTARLRTTTGSSARRTRCADGPLKGVEVGAYYSGNNAKKAFYTDLTGYNTAKDVVVVYVKKTF